MSDKFKVLVNGSEKCRYPTRKQCITWCYLNGFVLQSRYGNHLHPGVEIRKDQMKDEKKEDNHRNAECSGCKGIFLSKDLKELFPNHPLCPDCARKQAQAVRRSMR